MIAECKKAKICCDQTNQQTNKKTKNHSYLVGAVSAELRQLAQSHDVVPGIYEGGLKLWEGSLDLANHALSLPGSVFSQKRVCELGCGHSLPGLVALRRGAALLALHDYNEDVIESVTLPNLALNGFGGDARVRCFSGDWDSFEAPEACDLPGFDVILTAETVYSPAAAHKLARCISRILAKSNGSVAWVAAKSYYFGVGGGTMAFTEACGPLGLSVHPAIVIDDGKSNVREIVRVTWAEE